MQDETAGYVDYPLQIHTMDSTMNPIGLYHNEPLGQAFKYLQGKSVLVGSDHKVLSSYIDFRPYIMGMKVFVLEQKRSIKKVKKVHFDESKVH